MNRIKLRGRNNTRKNSTSNFYGVSEIIKKLKVTYRVDFRVDKNLRLYACYENKIHAAHQFNLWFCKYNRKGIKKNNIEIPRDFVEYKKIEKKDTDLPPGITRRGKKFRITPRMNGERVDRFYDLLEEAKFELNRIIHEEENRKFQMIFTTPILKNEEDQCIIELFNKKRTKVGETIVDEDMYHLLKMFSMHLSGGKAKITVNGKPMQLSKYIMDYGGKKYIGYVNTRNPLDNRRQNLKIITPQEVM